MSSQLSPLIEGCQRVLAILSAGAVIFWSARSVDARTLNISVQQLVASPQEYNGKIVNVVGYFECEFEAGCELRPSRKREDKLKTILLDLTQTQSVLLEKRKPLRGSIHVIGRFDYSKPTPEQLVSKADPRDPSSRAIVRVWQGFAFHACQITAITSLERE
jgi:hypothetical protein